MTSRTDSTLHPVLPASRRSVLPHTFAPLGSQTSSKLLAHNVRTDDVVFEINSALGGAECFEPCRIVFGRVIEQGFPNGNDAFDAVIGLFGMLEVVLGYRATGEPIDKAVSDIEGWILGQLRS